MVWVSARRSFATTRARLCSVLALVAALSCARVSAQSEDAGAPAPDAAPAPIKTEPKQLPDFEPAPPLEPERESTPPPAPEPSAAAIGQLPPLSLPPSAATAEYSARATATRAPGVARAVPASTITLERIDIDRHPAATSDGVLRSLPSAATFRRSSSLVADPSSQGLNLRGLAPSGVSRTLVLLDGVPQNDPFGGWVYWRSLPKLDIDRIEILHGGASALYGTAALGGVVQMFSRGAEQRGLDFDISYGNLSTFELAARMAQQFGVFGAAIEGEYLSSDGYRIVAPSDRGSVDGETPSEHGNVSGRFEVAITPQLRLTSRLGYFREVQNGGTRFTTAEVSLGTANVGLQYTSGAGLFELQLYGRRAEFDQVRARVGEGRNSEARASQQEVPAGDEGGTLSWTSEEIDGAGTHRIVAGIDARHVDGDSTDRIDPAMRMPDSVVEKSAGGQQWMVGAFVQDLWQIAPALDLQAALRGDLWRNYGGGRAIVRANDMRMEFESDASEEATISPRVGLLVRARDWLHLRATGYRAFRAPTLNELYRGFQVGTILTAANDQLGPEHLLGGELGVQLLTDFGLDVGVTGFLNVLEDPISNATLAAPLPDGSTRQRQNLGAARVHGLDFDARLRIGRNARLQFAYTWARSKVTDAGGGRMMSATLGKRLAQDPEHRATLGFILHDPRWFTTAIQLRVIGPQYEDDLNTLPMSGYAVLDATIARRIFGGWELYAAFENLLGADYLVGRAGVDTLGAPFTFRIGLRVRPALSPP